MRAVAILQDGLRDAQDENTERVAQFLKAETVESPHCKTVVAILRQRFITWLPAEERAAWSRKKFCRELRKHRAVKVGVANKLVALDVRLKDS
jgi:hypothetical protein